MNNNKHSKIIKNKYCILYVKNYLLEIVEDVAAGILRSWNFEKQIMFRFQELDPPIGCHHHPPPFPFHSHTAYSTHSLSYHYHFYQQFFPRLQPFSWLRLHQEPNKHKSFERTDGALISSYFLKAWTRITAHTMTDSSSFRLWKFVYCK